MDHRTCPIPFSNAEKGFCRWCGKALLKDGQRRWHVECKAVFVLHFFRDAQHHWLVERDPFCATCRGPVHKFRKLTLDRTIDGYFFTVVRMVEGGEVDHKIPLWSVRDLPDADRLKFYGPENLQLLCTACHADKTAKEAGSRAHFKSMKTKHEAPAKKGSIPSRGFDKRYRRKMNGKVERV